MLLGHVAALRACQVPADFQPQPNADEVDAVFAMPLSAFLDAHQHIHWDVRSKSTTQ
jgi:hypothetical protein